MSRSDLSHADLHHVPGRLRVRCPALKRNPHGAAAAAALLTAQAGVEGCEVNPLTGSVTIGYDRHRLDGRQIVALLHRHGYCRGDAPQPPREAPLTRPAGPGAFGGLLGKAGSTLGKIVVGTLVEKAVERSAIALIGALL